MTFIKEKQNRLFILLSAFFLVNAIVAEFMGVKIFSLEGTLGISNFTFHFFGEKIEGFALTCGVLLWPFVFVMTDIINEYFGTKGVRFLSYIAAGLIAYSYIALQLAMRSTPAAWWVNSSQFGKELNYGLAYNAVFGQSSSIIVGSLIAFLLGQLIDVGIFHWIKKRTGEKYIWLRSTGSTLVSQLIDSFVVLFYAFYISKIGTPQQWSLPLVLAVCSVNYIYKFLMAVVMTPVIYLVHQAIENYLGHDLAARLKTEAAALD
ncbi:MAG: queuosine precursor transporter [Chitinophagales bacterium]